MRVVPLASNDSVHVRDTEILATDPPQHYREKLARIALDEMYHFVAILDASGTLLEVNRAALEGAGLTLADVEGKPFWQCFWWAVSPKIQDTLRSSIARVAQGEFIRYDVEIYGRAGGTATIIIDFSLIPVKDKTGNVVFIIPEGRDITEKKAYELEIAKKNEDLQSLLERIRELDEIKSQFFANVSHELRTPLALIIGPAQRLLQSDAEMSPEIQRDTAKVIVRNARMLLKHVNDLLDISKLEAHKLKIDLQETDVTELVRFIASHFDILAVERSVNFLLETGPSYIAAIDPEKLQRVVMNLLSNAFKFVPAGGTVRCSMQTAAKELVLSVEDSGPGIKQEMRKVIFERFSQGEGGTNRQFAGTGLGLAIVYEFVTMHKGTIEVGDSNLGGALFTIRLPVTNADASAVRPVLPTPAFDPDTMECLIEELRLPAMLAPAPETDNHINLNREIVLVVEDNREMNKFITQSLTAEYEVISAFDGQEGLQKALHFHPALIVSDIIMPGVSGVQMIAELRKHPEMLQTPILLLSAKEDEELKLQLLEKSAQDFISKPFNERELQVRIRNLISMRKSAEELRQNEKRLNEQSAWLEQQVQERTMALKELNLSLTLSNEDLQQFAHVTSHDLKEPIRKIKMYSSRIQDEYQHLLPEKGNVFLNKIQSASNRVFSMIEGILSYSTLASADDPAVMVDLNDVLKNIESDLEVLIEEKNATLLIEQLPHVNGVPVLLYQLFYNLVNNALKFSKIIEPPVIIIQYSSVKLDGSNFAKISLADNGIGFDQEQSEKIFITFTRLNSKDQYEGTGLGLTLCKKIVQRHGGFISANGVENKGAEFIVLLPLS
jgi:PAS domain S-box-containing protein